MCQFGNETKILEELNISKSEGLVGWRNNYITHSLDDKEKFLRAIRNDYLYPKDRDAEGLGLERDNSLGIYNYNNYNYNNYYNYYNNYNYYNYNNYNYNNYYNVQVKTIHYGKIFKYDKGYRSEYCKVTHLIILDKDSKWFLDPNTIKFANHFNNLLESLAKEYNCETLEWSKRS